MRAPLHLELEMMWSNTAFASFVAHALIDQLFHSLNELRSCKAAFGRYSAPKFPINYIAHAFQHAPEKALRQSLFALLFDHRLLLFTHELNTTVAR